MDLYKEILTEILAKEQVEVVFPNLRIDPNQAVELSCYQALRLIREILRRDDFTDEECFARIEAVVESIEEIGGSCGNRHDFG